MPIDPLMLRAHRGHNPDILRHSEQQRGHSVAETVDKALQLDIEWRELQGQVDSLRRERKGITRSIRDLIKCNRRVEAEKDIARSKEILVEINDKAKTLAQLKINLDTAIASIGNVLTENVLESTSDQSCLQFNAMQGYRPGKSFAEKVGAVFHESYQTHGMGIPSLSQVLHKSILFFKSHGYTPVTTVQGKSIPALNPIASESADLKQAYAFRKAGPVLLAYRNSYLPEASLPLKYLSNEGKGFLSLTVLCAPSQDDQIWLEMKRLGSGYVLEMLGKERFSECCFVIDRIPDARVLGLASTRESTIAMKRDIIYHTQDSMNTTLKPSIWGNEWCSDIVLCSKSTTYLSRELEVRCGHGKARQGGSRSFVGGVGAVKTYVHAMRMTVDTNNILAALHKVKPRHSYFADAGDFHDLFTPLVLQQSGKSASSQKSKRTSHKDAKKMSKKIAESRAVREKKGAKTIRPKKSMTPKLCTNTGLRELESLLSRQSFLCGCKGYCMTQEDVVVWTKLAEWLHARARVAVEEISSQVSKASSENPQNAKMDNAYLPCRECKHIYGKEMCCLCVGSTSPPHLDQRAYQADGVTPRKLRPNCSVCRARILRRLKDGLKLKHGAIMESLVHSSEAQLKGLGVSLQLSSFVRPGPNTWRWFRCMSALSKEARDQCLPSLGHLKSGRLSLLFDL